MSANLHSVFLRTHPRFVTERRANVTKSENILLQIQNAIVNLDIPTLQKLCGQAIAERIQPNKVITDGMAKGMEIVGNKYEHNEYFLTELIMAGETMKQGLKVLEPVLKKSEMKPIGKIVIATVKGDLHDIGKNVFATLMGASGFAVIDLGTDVSTEKIIETVKRDRPNMVGLSALLTTTMINMEDVVAHLKKAGLRDKVRLIVGGAPVTSEYAKRIGADASAIDAVEGVNICRSWLKQDRA
jgi:5-methyltetrahydrofolate--homocysteine methyltransferase